MKLASFSLFIAVVSNSYSNSYAFVNKSAWSISAPKSSSTELYIIGPMIRKMREQNAQNKMPMASDTDKMGEAEGVRVGDGAWKWPPVWPYDGDAFIPKQDIKKPPQASPMGAMLGQMPAMDQIEQDEEQESKFDVMKYWQEEKADVTTDVDEAAAKKLSE
jgi:hypothetical protein